MSAFLSPVEPAGQDISLASHVLLPWRSGKPRADTRAKGSHVAADAARKNPLSKHAASERHAKHNHLAPHSFTRYLISGCHVWKTLLSYSHDTSPPTAVCRV